MSAPGSSGGGFRLGLGCSSRGNQVFNEVFNQVFNQVFKRGVHPSP